MTSHSALSFTFVNAGLNLCYTAPSLRFYRLEAPAMSGDTVLHSTGDSYSVLLDATKAKKRWAEVCEPI